MYPTRTRIALGRALSGAFLAGPWEEDALVERGAGRQRVCGMVVNVVPNVAREEYDRLRAILHDAAAHGPEHADRAGLPDFRAHLTGRVAWAAWLNPARGARLRARLDVIAWR